MPSQSAAADFSIISISIATKSLAGAASPSALALTKELGRFAQRRS